MNWMVFFYYPVACLAVGGVGFWAIGHQPVHRSWRLELSRSVVLFFPLILLATCLLKRTGPLLWSRLASPLAGRAVLLPALFLLIFVRWLAEMTAFRAFQEMEAGPGMARAADKAVLRATDFEGMRSSLGTSWWRWLLPGPTLLLSRTANLGHLMAGIRPRICLEASLVPPDLREKDEWWASVPAHATEPAEKLKAVVAHELGHFKHGDHLRKIVLSLSAALLPWEWFFEDVLLGKFSITNAWLFRRWSGLMRWVGSPFRAWVRRDRQIKEDLADEEATLLVPDAAQHLEDLRSQYPLPQCPSKGMNPAQATAIPAPARHAALVLLSAALLWGAPGRIPYLLTFGTQMETTTLPRSWCLVSAPGSEASAVFLPGKGEPGTIIVKCPRISLEQPSLLRAMGRIPPEGLPGECDIEMEWEVLYEGQGQMTGKEAFLSVTQSSMTVRTNQDPFTAYSQPQVAPGGVPGGHWHRYVSVTKIRNKPALEHMLIGFNLSSPGQYVIKPPVLALVLANGERTPFPLA